MKKVKLTEIQAREIANCCELVLERQPDKMGSHARIDLLELWEKMLIPEDVELTEEEILFIQIEISAMMLIYDCIPYIKSHEKTKYNNMCEDLLRKLGVPRITRPGSSTK